MLAVACRMPPGVWYVLIRRIVSLVMKVRYYVPAAKMHNDGAPLNHGNAVYLPAGAKKIGDQPTFRALLPRYRAAWRAPKYVCRAAAPAMVRDAEHLTGNPLESKSVTTARPYVLEQHGDNARLRQINGSLGDNHQKST